MLPLVRILRLLTLVVWVGGIVFFAFVVAPVAFKTLPSTHLAGTVVAGTLGVLNFIGVVCGVMLLIACSVLWLTATSVTGGRFRPVIGAQLCLVTLMLAGTAYLKWSIVPAMERDRLAAGGKLDEASIKNPARADFDRLHSISEKLEGVILLCGLGLVVLIELDPSGQALPVFTAERSNTRA